MCLPLLMFLIICNMSNQVQTLFYLLGNFYKMFKIVTAR